MECGGCTLCCKLLNIPWMKSPAGVYCKQCSVNKGCKVYSNAPKNCLEYQCAYSQMEKVSLNLRPDKCHVIFERAGDDIFIGLQDPKYPISDFAKAQISAFQHQGFSVSLSVFNFGPPSIFPKQGSKAEDVFKRVKWLLASKYGNASILN